MRHHFSAECIYRPPKAWGGGYLKVSEVKKIIRVISLRFLIKYFFFTIKPLKRIKYTLFWNEIYNILLSFVAEPID